MLIFAYIKEILLGASAFIALYLFNRNKNLKTEKEQLKEQTEDQNKLINIQQKVLDVSENVKPTDLDSVLDKLSESKDTRPKDR